MGSPKCMGTIYIYREKISLNLKLCPFLAREIVLVLKCPLYLLISLYRQILSMFASESVSSKVHGLQRVLSVIFLSMWLHVF